MSVAHGGAVRSGTGRAENSGCGGRPRGPTGVGVPAPLGVPIWPSGRRGVGGGLQGPGPPPVGSRGRLPLLPARAWGGQGLPSWRGRPQRAAVGWAPCGGAGELMACLPASGPQLSPPRPFHRRLWPPPARGRGRLDGASAGTAWSYPGARVRPVRPPPPRPPPALRAGRGCPSVSRTRGLGGPRFPCSLTVVVLGSSCRGRGWAPAGWAVRPRSSVCKSPSVGPPGRCFRAGLAAHRPPMASRSPQGPAALRVASVLLGARSFSPVTFLSLCAGSGGFCVPALGHPSRESTGVCRAARGGIRRSLGRGHMVLAGQEEACGPVWRVWEPLLFWGRESCPQSPPAAAGPWLEGRGGGEAVWGACRRPGDEGWPALTG